MGFGRELKDFAEGFQKGVEVGSEQDKARAEWEKYRPIKPSDVEGQPDETAGAGATVPTTEGDQTSSTGTPGDPRYREAIAGIESGGKYDALGPWTGDPEEGRDRAYGKYQVMGKNVPVWTKQALGKAMTPQEFLADPKAQDAVFDHIFGGYVKQFGERGAAQAWFGGPGSVGKESRKDVLGTTIKGYGDRFVEALSKMPKTETAPTQAIDEPDQTTTAATPPAEKPTYTSTADGLNPKMKKVYDRAARDNPGLFALNPYTQAGARTEAQQKEMVDKGYSTTMHSKHRQGKAVDIVPINPATGKPDPDFSAGYDKIQKAMRKAAQDEGIDDLTWGGEWKSFQDKPHWQVSMLQNQQLQPGGPAPPIEEDQVRPTMFAARGGVIPEPPQYFADGGMPDPMAKARALGLSGGTWVNQPGVSTPAAVGGAASFTPRRVGMPASDIATSTGPTPSQIAFANARAASAARAAVPKPVAEAPAAPAPAAQPVKVRQQGMNVVMPYGNQGGAFGYAPGPQWVKNPTTGKISQRGQRFEQGGVIPEPEDTAAFARGGSVRDTRFQELLRQEGSQSRSVRGDGGESARDRAARRLSAEEGRASSTAYRPSQDKEYFEPADKPRKKPGKKDGDKPDSEKTSSTETHVRHPPNPTVGMPEPEIEEDRATRFRESELVPGPSSTRRLEDQGPPVPGASTAPVGPGGTPTGPYEPAHPPGGLRVPGSPIITPAPVVPPPVTGDPSTGAQPKPTIGTTKTAPTAETAVKPGPKAPVLQPRLPQPSDPARTAADVADTRKRMELVTTPPSNRLVPLLYDPATGQLHDPNEAPVREMPGEPTVVMPSPTRFGYQEGGVIPEPGQPGYNEAVAEGATATQEPQAAEPQRANVRATPKLVSDVRKAVDGGVRFLTRHFGVGGEGAVPTPDDGATTDDGTRRFASGEGAATPDEVSSIDDQVDPTRELNEGKRQMARLAKTMRWYQGRGRKEEAEAAAGSLMQYGASRFSRLGSMSQAAYNQYLKTGDPAHLDKTVKFLEKAYEMIPDGAEVNVRINSQTGKLEALHTDDEGDETYMEVDPQELPGLLKSVQDKSMYWNSVFRIADPEGAKSKDIERRTIATEQRGERADIRKEGRGDIREQQKEARTQEAEIAKEGRTQTAEIAKEGRGVEAEKAKEVRTAQATRNQKLLDEALLRSRPAKPTGSQKDMAKLAPLLAEADAADAADKEGSTPETKAARDAAISKLYIAADGDVTWLTNNGYHPGDFQFTDPGAAEAATAATKAPEGHPNAKRMKDPKSGQPIWAEQDANGKWFQVVTE
jgi:D-alanyl-D-alanine carboxypeptidase